MKIGNQIRHRRTELNLSRGELANKIQVTPSAYSYSKCLGTPTIYYYCGGW